MCTATLINSDFISWIKGHAKRIKVPDTYDTVEEEKPPSVAKVWENKGKVLGINRVMCGP